MIVDSSVIVAILRGEPKSRLYAEAMRDSRSPRMSAATFLECAVVVDRHSDPARGRDLDALLKDSRIDLQPVTPQQAQVARQAYRDYGRGSGHPAKLNFGDCFSYALAVDTGEPLLYQGDDFSHTDVRSALDL